MSLEIQVEIQRNLARYLEGCLKLNEFEDWFIPVLWGLRDEDDESRRFAGRISNVIAETARGDRTVESLRKELASTIRRFGLEKSPDSVQRFYALRGSLDRSLTDMPTRIPLGEPIRLSEEFPYTTPLIGGELQAEA